MPIGGQSVVTTDRKEAIKIYIREHGEVKTADLVKAFALSDGYMRALLREMVNAGTLEKLEDKRYTRYKLSDEG
ncbi:MAG: winged helix DNA-binding protein [Lachnoclostridium sp.]|nr:winged helix DNA-binding protein [Lachnoclostridium sp.]